MVIKKNIEKTHMQDKTTVIQKDWMQVLEIMQGEKRQFDIIFLDPPYRSCYDVMALEGIIKKNLLTQEGIIVIETDEEEKIGLIEQIEGVTLRDVRKYGRVKLVFAQLTKGVK